MRNDFLQSLLARINVFSLHRLFHRKPKQQWRPARECAMNENPELNALDEKTIRAQRSMSVGSDGSYNKRQASEKSFFYVDSQGTALSSQLYNHVRRRQELLNKEPLPHKPVENNHVSDGDSGKSIHGEPQAAPLSPAEYGDLLSPFSLRTPPPNSPTTSIGEDDGEQHVSADVTDQVSPAQRAASEAALNGYMQRKEKPPSQELLAKQKRPREIPSRTASLDDDANAATHASLNENAQPLTASKFLSSASHRSLADPPSAIGDEGNVVAFPLKRRRLGIADSLAAAGYQDIDGITAGMERLSLALPGNYLALSWYTRVRRSGECLDMILCTHTFYGEIPARNFAFSAIDHLARAGAIPEPSKIAYGPRLRPSIPEIARASVRVTDDKTPSENHVSVIALGPFPSNIVGEELVEIFGNARERRALNDLFAFYGPANTTAAAWWEDDADENKLGSPAWFYYQLIPLVGTEEQKSEWVENRFVKIHDDNARSLSVEEAFAQVNKTPWTKKSKEVKVLETPAEVDIDVSTEAKAQKPYSLPEWQDFMRDVDRSTTFHDFASAFLGVQLYSILPELKRLVDKADAKDKTAVYAVKNGEIYSVWLDEFHNHLAIDMAAKDDVPAHVALLSLNPQ